MTDSERFDGILIDIWREADRSIQKHGEQVHLPNGTGRFTQPLDFQPTGKLSHNDFAFLIAEMATAVTDAHSFSKGDGTVSWWDILREEVFEAAAEEDPAKLRAELVQVAAVAVKWIDAIDQKGRET